jgi:isoleucyl-tRNA synthetase
MQAVIEAGRAIREKNNRPLKQPLRRVVVVHPDPDFLADITGGLFILLFLKLQDHQVEQPEVKQPLRRVVVVHPDPDFLADIIGGLLVTL